MSEATGPLDRFRRPEYTGENRCVPCTAVNVAIAVSAALVVGTWGALAVGTAVAGGAAAAVLVAGLAAIWLRGYLVPGTPTLTKRYFPERVLAAFGKEPAAGALAGDPEVGTHAGGDAEVDVERRLLEAGMVEPCRDGDLCLTDPVRERWHERIAAFDDDWAAILARVDVCESGADVETETRSRDAFVIRVDGRFVGRWESRPAAVADLTALTFLPEYVDDWPDLSTSDRSELAVGLRLFLERCPACDGPVSFGTDTVESCCREVEVAAATCEDCDARLFEVPTEAAGPA